MKMKICNHWTGGTNKPCNTDLKAYHYLIDGEGRIYKGIFTPYDNINCFDGKYAKHCGGGNTNCIGVSLCGMSGFTENKKLTKYPITKKQIETMCALNAYLSKEFLIKISPDYIFTHFEFDQKQAKKKGKIDITYLPFLPELKKEEVGDYLRNKILWYRNKKLELKKKGNFYEI